MADVISQWATNDLISAVRLNDDEKHTLKLQGDASGEIALRVYKGDSTGTADLMQVLDASSSPLVWVDQNGTLVGTVGIVGRRGAAGASALLTDVTGDSNFRYAVSADGSTSWGPGNAALDVMLSRGAANRLDLASGDTFRIATDGSAGSLQFGASGDASLFRGNTDRLDLTGGDSFNIVNGSLQFTGVTVLTGSTLTLGNDAAWTRGAANRMDLASGDDLNVVLGNFRIAGTTLFESDRDLAVALIPNADDTIDLGSATREFRNLWVDGTAEIDKLVLDAAAGSGLGSNLIPDVADSYSIGSTSRPVNALVVGSGGIRVTGNAQASGGFQRAQANATVASGVPGRTTITVTWPSTFGVTTYKVAIAWENASDATADDIICHGISSKTASAIGVRFENTNAVSGRSVTVYAIAWRD